MKAVIDRIGETIAVIVIPGRKISGSISHPRSFRQDPAREISLPSLSNGMRLRPAKHRPVSPVSSGT
jgi:hypothetical protein